MSPPSLPCATARARTSSTWVRAPFGDTAPRNTAAAFRAANSRPRSDDPAWQWIGVRCGKASER
ncbi:hypothetical protein RI060_37460 [Streptomyces janthinus]|uniref:Uncharacterized protein n=1 Tax=Streptomyces violaceus TaxID=1936 RepID=A0ABY9UIK7_STRVL|nr:hypothetical protein [Streptomyces janthinus]WND22697.1 hypothetical protein RI060_37460 [Streptomyces janthinus]